MIHTYMWAYLHICIYMYDFLCPFVCMCAQNFSLRQTIGTNMCVWVCACVRVCVLHVSIAVLYSVRVCVCQSYINHQ